MAGAINVPGFSSRVAVLCGGGQLSIYKDVEPSYVPRDFTGPIDINVILSGTGKGEERFCSYCGNAVKATVRPLCADSRPAVKICITTTFV